MAKYRKKPVVIDAIRFEYSENGLMKLRSFCGDCVGTFTKARHPNAEGQVQIMTLEDGAGKLVVAHIATEGDYIIRGVAGEFYACKPDIFEMTYEKVE